jgi:hypothetical protein
VIVAIAALVATATISDRFEVRLALGSEWDTNARRTITSSASGDGVARLVAELDYELALAQDHVIHLGYVLGTKRFFGEPTEDLLVHNLTGTTVHSLSETFGLGTGASFRASRLRSGLRDYSIAVVTGAFMIKWLPNFDTSIGGAFTRFDFVPDRRLSFSAPTVVLEATLDFFDNFVATARAAHTWRDFDGNALIYVPELDALTYCDGRDDTAVFPACTPRLRTDTEILAMLRLGYRGKWRANVEYLLRRQRSSSDVEDIDRHRFSLQAAIPLFFGLTANISAALQVNNGVSSSETLLLAEDDENQNNVQLGLSRGLGDRLSLEVRYALFSADFTTVDVSFVRQTFYGGVSYRLGE